MYAVQYVNKTNHVIHFELLTTITTFEQLATWVAHVEGRGLQPALLSKFEIKLLNTVEISDSQESGHGIGWTHPYVTIEE